MKTAVMMTALLAALYAGAPETANEPGYGVEEEIVATVLESSAKEVSKAITRVVNVTLRVAVEEVLFTQHGLERGTALCVIYTRHGYGDEPPEPPLYTKGQRLRMQLRSFETGRCYRPAFATGSFELLESQPDTRSRIDATQ